MATIRRNGHWIVALAGVFCLGIAAAGWLDRLPALHAAPADNGHVAQGLAEAHTLSDAFRHAAKSALPGVVSITTSSRASLVRGQGEPEQLDELFGEMFRNDPRLKDLFRRGVPRQSPRTQGMGSGFIFDPSGVILTANHVVAGATQVKVKLNDGREYIATDVKTDPNTDVAIVRIQAEDKLPTVKLGNSDALEVGDWVLAIGSPFGLDATVTAGIISAKGRGAQLANREDFLQTDAAINPGNSGGPLINLRGEVVGINTAISTRSGGYDGVGFAVPINMAHWVSDQLVEKGEVSRAYIGVGIQPVADDLARQIGVPVGKGALVTQVMPGSPAEAARLEAGDLVLKFDGKDVHGTRDLQGIVERLKPGHSYPMLILRDGKEITVNVQVKEMPRDYALASNTLVPNRPTETPKTDSFSEIGLEIEAVRPEVLKQLGFKDEKEEKTEGVLITSVKEDSPAAETAPPLREGMVIQKVGSQWVKSPEEFRQAIKGASVKDGILLLVKTPRTSQFVVVKGEPQK
ncbi:MAG: Do family serine endopeptidase [Planctomycetaceae bacterium]